MDPADVHSDVQRMTTNIGTVVTLLDFFFWPTHWSLHGCVRQTARDGRWPAVFSGHASGYIRCAVSCALCLVPGAYFDHVSCCPGRNSCISGGCLRPWYC